MYKEKEITVAWMALVDQPAAVKTKCDRMGKKATDALEPGWASHTTIGAQTILRKQQARHRVIQKPSHQRS